MTEDTKIEMKDKIDWLGLFVNGLVYLIKGLIFLVSTPIFLGMWLINFIKMFFSSILFWIIGKGAIVFLTMIVTAGAAEINIMTFETHERILSGVTDLLFTSHGDEINQVLPHFNIEITLIIILAVVTATMMTIDPDRI